MSALLAAALRALAPVLIQEARAFLRSEDGKRFVADAKALALEVVKEEFATAEPLHPENRDQPGMGITGEPLP